VTDTTAIPVAELVPHRPPLLLIDRLESHDAGGSVARAAIRADNVFLEGGAVPAWAGIEYMAQTIAAHAGAAARLRGEPSAIGFLVGTRAYRSAVAAFPLGSRVTVTVRPLFAEGGLAAFECSLDLNDDAAVATAVVNTYVPSGDELARLRAEAPPS
jgi:predicted hotdog family 3-hydroxylacyl-ACP dehydratase